MKSPPQIVLVHNLVKNILSSVFVLVVSVDTLHFHTSRTHNNLRVLDATMHDHFSIR